DDGTADSKLVYRVYVSDTKGMEDFKTPLLETKPGALSAVIDHSDPASPTFQLEPQTTYYAVVRAVDASGNEDDNTNELAATTLEGVPPVFGGARLAAAEPGGIRLYWAPANDLQPGPDGKPTGTEAANIVYQIFQGTASGGEDLAKPTYVSPPAALDFLVPDVKPGQRYYFIVRALDSASNDDGNTVEVSAQAVAPSDTTSPAFSGVTSVVGTSPSTLKVSWSPASDPPNASSSIAYDVYFSDTAKGESFSAPNISTAPGATSAEIVGLQPGVTRYVVVRARDAVGNELANTTEVSGTTLAATTDVKAPVFNGGVTVTIPGDGNPFALDVDWATATDDVSATADIRYHVCAEAVETNCVGSEFASHVHTVTDWGVTAATVPLLDSHTRYYVYVRAEDRGGNMETGNHSGFATTLTAWSRDVQPLLYQKCGSCHDYYVSPVNLVGVSSSFIDPRLNPSTEIGTVRVCTGTNNSSCSDQPGQVSRIKLVKPGHPELSSLYRRINHLGTTLAPFSGAVPDNYSGTQEPRDGANLTFTPLTPLEDAAIRDWITQGAFAF
ncbi:MAG TPA: fibronectin type III domain-containing protein, partial [Polyangiaceae bacterium]|nr:fibronectin type III domain-containing protein [Polyangiaceae bacterium]